MKLRTLESALVLLIIASDAWSEEPSPRPFLHPFYNNNMVLQRDRRLRVWGWAAPGEKVAVSLGGQSASGVAGSSGEWEVGIGPFPAGGPHYLTVQGSHPVVLTNVLVGDVWLCAGQSNMEMGVGACGYTNEISGADFARLRLMRQPKQMALQPIHAASGPWRVCSPDSVREGGWGGFSAVAYFFGRNLHEATGVPIGLIQCSWGGTPAETWMSRSALQAFPEFNTAISELDDYGLIEEERAFSTRFDRWSRANDPGLNDGWNAPAAPETDWNPVNSPDGFIATLPEGFRGIVWLRREFDWQLSSGGIEKLTLHTDPLGDMDTVWLNGVQLGRHRHTTMAGRYCGPATALHSGTNVLAVRAVIAVGSRRGNSAGSPTTLEVSGSKTNHSQMLVGGWRTHVVDRTSDGFQLLPDPRENFRPHAPSVVFNGMIAPLTHAAIKGVIWYQGESNLGRARQYRRMLPALIADWRQTLGDTKLPFILVQLPACGKPQVEPQASKWAALRDAQAQTVRQDANCRLVVTIDVGGQSIHPTNKSPIGERLARVARAQYYGESLESSGPVYREMKTAGGRIYLSFDHADGGLAIRGGALRGFMIAGEDRQFMRADAAIDGDTVVVLSQEIVEPMAVRYAWEDYPEANLYNHAGLPALPFRTDTWPLLEEDF